jgi:hypothetical protein
MYFGIIFFCPIRKMDEVVRISFSGPIVKVVLGYIYNFTWIIYNFGIWIVYN